MNPPAYGTAALQREFPELAEPIEKARIAAPEIINDGHRFIEKRFTSEDELQAWLKRRDAYDYWNEWKSGRWKPSIEVLQTWRTSSVIDWAKSRDVSSREKACAIIALLRSLGIDDPKLRASLPMPLRAHLKELRLELGYWKADLVLAADAARSVIARPRKKLRRSHAKSLRETRGLTAVENKTIEAVGKHGGNVSRAALELGVARGTARNNFARATEKLNRIEGGKSRNVRTASRIPEDKRGQALVSRRSGE